MKKTSHSRPHLDHLRRQAKALLASLPDDDASARIFAEHLPAAHGMTPTQVRAAGFRLADAQSALARMEGFSSWPGLASYVDVLRGMEGTWRFTAMEMEGAVLPHQRFEHARLFMDGDRFCMQSPAADYDGVFNIDVEATPHRIDIHFEHGPDAGSTCEGIFAWDGDRLRLCLAIEGAPRPAAFSTRPGIGWVLEELERVDASRPAPAPRPTVTADASDYAYVPADVYDALEGEWRAVSAMRDGEPMPAPMLASGVRRGKGNEVVVKFGGRAVIDALIRIDSETLPTRIDYLHRSGPYKGQVQFGIMKIEHGEATFCSAPVGHDRPQDFQCPMGSGRTLSRWRK